MNALVRDLLRQRLRTALTVSGIGLGILTLVVLGALGEHFRTMVDEAQTYTEGVVRLYTKTNDQGFNPGITPETVEQIRALPQVEDVCPNLQLWFDGFDLESSPLAFLKPKPFVMGLPAARMRDLRPSLELLGGRWLRQGDARHAVVVDWLAAKRGLAVGDTVRIRHMDYELVGIYRAPEAPLIPAGFAPYEILNADFLLPQVERAERFLGALLEQSPFLRGLLAQQGEAGLDLSALARRFVEQQQGLFRVYEVLPADRAQTMALAETLRDMVPELAVIDPERLAADMEDAIAMFLVITTVVTVISTVVGGLLIVNTMAMAVVERRSEIAVRVAMGATPSQVAGEFVIEAGMGHDRLTPVSPHPPTAAGLGGVRRADRRGGRRLARPARGARRPGDRVEGAVSDPRAVIACQALRKEYPGPSGPVVALDSVDLRVEPGETLAITGPSGCGKTTLLNLLGALDRPSAGTLEVCGELLGHLDATQRALFRRRRLGFVFQQYRLIPTLTALENVTLPLRYAGVPLPERRERASALLERVGLAGRADHLPSRLSGGEQQRVAVARALVSDPELILADEPTGNLDGETAQGIVDLLLSAAAGGTALVLVTHDPEVAGVMSRQVRLRSGRVDSADR
jgi:ABC-type lipoprotein export system ATPase subunit